MRKMLSWLLALSMLISLTPAAFAVNYDELDDSTDATFVETIENVDDTNETGDIEGDSATSPEIEASLEEIGDSEDEQNGDGESDDDTISEDVENSNIQEPDSSDENKIEDEVVSDSDSEDNVNESNTEENQDLTGIDEVTASSDSVLMTTNSLEEHIHDTTNGTCSCGMAGTCGENLTWTFDTVTGVLTISGTGAMYDYDGETVKPWGDYLQDIRTITFDSGITKIGVFAFGSCTALTDVNLPEGLIEIGSLAFNYCPNLKNIEIPSTVETLGWSVFYDCAMESIVIPDGVTTISDELFLNCTQLKEVTLPAGITAIGYQAFFGCSALETIKFNGTESTWNEIIIGEGNDPVYDAAIVYGGDGEDEEVTPGHIEFRYCFGEDYEEDTTSYTDFVTDYPYSMNGKFYAMNSDGSGNPLPADSIVSSNPDVAVITPIVGAGDSCLVTIQPKGIGTTEISLSGSSDFIPMNVTVKLPPVAYYSQPVAEFEYYIDMDEGAFEVTESNRTVYLVASGQRTLTNVELRDELANYATCEILPAGNAAVITFNDDLPATDEWGTRYSVFQQYNSTEPGESGGGGDRQLCVINLESNSGEAEEEPYLFATWAGSDISEGFAEYQLPKQGSCSFEFWFGNEEEAVKVAYEDLSIRGIVDIAEVENYVNGELVSCINVSATGFGEGAIIYTDADGVIYEFPVTCSLPYRWVYSSEVRSEETYLDALSGNAGEPMEFYLLSAENATAVTGLTVTDNNGNEIPVTFSGDTGLVQMTAPTSGGWLNFNMIFDGWSEGFGIEYINTAPHLFATWADDSSFDNTFDSFEIEYNSGCGFTFYFGTTLSAEQLAFEDLSATGVVSISDDVYYNENGEWISAVGVRVTDFGEGAVAYTDADGVTYEFPVTCSLPNYGFYSSDVRSEETYLDALSGNAGEPMEFYLLAAENMSAIIGLTAIDENGNEIPVVYSQNGLVQMTAPERGGSLIFRIELDGWTYEYWIEYINTAPHLFAQYPGEEYLETSYSGAPSEHMGNIFDFYFGYPGNAVKLDVADLTAEGVAVIEEVTYTDNNGVEYLVCFVRAADFGEGAVVYTADGVDYKFPVYGELPELGLYSTDTLSEETYINSYSGAVGETKTVYMLGTDEFFQYNTISGVTGRYYGVNGWTELDVTATPIEKGYEVTFTSPGGDIELIAQMGNYNNYVMLFYTGGSEHTHTEGETVKENETAATCTTAGSYDSVVYCSECGEEVSRETIAVPAAGHDITNGTCECGMAGICGDNLTWTRDDYGLLTISGTGAMYDYVSITDGSAETSPFAGASKIGGLYIEEGVTYIGSNAFESCVFSSIILPSTLEAMSENAFAYCENLTSILYSGSAEEWLNVSLSVGNDALITADIYLNEGSGKCGEELFWQYEDGTLRFMARGSGSGMDTYEAGSAPWLVYADDMTKIDMQKGMTISDGAFYGLRNVTEVSLPTSLLYFQDAFGDLTALEKIEIPAENDGGYVVTEDGLALLRSNTEVEGTYSLYAVAPTAGEEFTVPAGVTGIHFNAFKNCANITTLNIPATTALVLENAFSGCAALTTVNYGGTETEWAAVEIQTGNDALTNATVVYAEEEIPSGTCGDNLTWTLEDCVLTISGTGAMYDYVSLTDGNGRLSPFAGSSIIRYVQINNGVTSIGSHAFESCVLDWVMFTDSVTYIGDNAFAHCDTLSEVFYHPFVGSGLENATIGTGNECLLNLCEDYMHMHNFVDGSCSCGMIKGTCGDNVTWFFDKSTGLMVVNGSGEMTDWTSLEEVPWHDYRDAITTVEIGPGLSSIGDYAFASCENLTTVKNLYDGASSDLTTIGESAFAGCSGLKSVVLGEATTVEASAFSGCTALTTVYYDGTESDWANVTIADDNDPLLNATVLYDKAENITQETMDEAIADSVETGVVNVPVNENADAANIPADSIGAVADNNAALEVELEDVTVSVDAAAVAAIKEQAAGTEITLRVEEIDTIELNSIQQEALQTENVVVTIQATVLSNGEYISDFKGGLVTLMIPFVLAEGKTAEDYGVLYIADDGTIEKMIAAYENGAFVFEVEHFSEYVITTDHVHTEGEAVVENAVDATCTAAGSYDSVVYCSVCGEEVSRETVTVPMIEHVDEAGDGICDVCGGDMGLLGDINDDGVIDGRDVVRLKRYAGKVPGMEVHEKNSDVNKDGIIDGRDVIRLSRYVGKVPGVELG